MKNIKPKIVAAFFAASILATGCNTISGAGQDLESVGKKTSEVADDVKN
jgi:predicted small secreted protein